jgi:hypothetical protein
MADPGIGPRGDTEMRRRFVMAAALLVLTSGCGHQWNALDADIARAPIYETVLREYLIATGSSYSAIDVYVLDVADSAQIPTVDPALSGIRESITPADQHAIIIGLADVAKVQFVAARDSVVESKDGCPQVRGGGLLITLSPPIGDARRVEVGIDGILTCSGGSSITYVVERAGEAWAVSGTTGVGGGARRRHDRPTS